MDFKQAWKFVGNAAPGNTTWSADVPGKPVFTAWASRDLRFEKETHRSEFYSPPGDWIQRGEGQSYIRRARQAMANNWACRLILLEGEDPWEKVKSAYLDDRFYAVKFTQVEDDETIRGELVARASYSD